MSTSRRGARLRRAVIDQDEVQVARLVRARGIDECDATGLTALYLAASRGSHVIVRLLLEAGANPNVVTSLGRTPFHSALSSPFATSEVIELLRAHGADTIGPIDVTTVDRAGRTPLHYAASDFTVGGTLLVAALLDGGADVGARDVSGRTPLHAAAGGEHPPRARLLLDAGAEVDAVDDDGNTPLICATKQSSAAAEMIALLRARGADPHVANAAGWSALALAKRETIGGNSEQTKRAFADMPDPPPRQIRPHAAAAVTPEGAIRQAILLLRDEGLRNGNINWVEGNYAALAERVGEALDDPSIFTGAELTGLRADLGKIADRNWLASSTCSRTEPDDVVFDRLMAAWQRWKSSPAP